MSGVQISTWARQFFCPFSFHFFFKLGVRKGETGYFKKILFQSCFIRKESVLCVCFFLRSWIFFVPAVHAASRKPKFYTAFALSSSSRHRFFDPFLRGFLAQFSMFYWPAMYYYVAICRLAFVCNASVLCI